MNDETNISHYHPIHYNNIIDILHN